MTVTPAASLGQVAEPAPVAGRIDPARREAVGITTALEAWAAELGRVGSRDRPRKLSRVRRLATGIGAAVPDDMTKTAILKHLAARRAGSPKDDEEPIKAKTHDLILGDLRGFLGLCKSHGWIASNPADDIPLLGRGVHEDPNDTGAFLYDEYLRLVAAAQTDEQGPKRFGFVRSPLYAVMFHAGLRVGEAHRLCWQDFALGREANIRCRKAASKNAKLTWLPLHADAAAIMGAFRPAGAVPSDRLWTVECHERVLQSDMAAAGVPAVGQDGLPRSFAAFRKGLATWLAMRGVQPALVQRMMRHSDIRLTMQFYTRLQVSDLRAVVARDEQTLRNPLDRAGVAPDDVDVQALDMTTTLTSHDDRTAGLPAPVVIAPEQRSDLAGRPTGGRRGGTHHLSASPTTRSAGPMPRGGLEPPLAFQAPLAGGNAAHGPTGEPPHLDNLIAAHASLVASHAALVHLASGGRARPYAQESK